MTDKPTPTDAELDTILCANWPGFAMQSTLVKIWVRDAMQDAIDKWGTPAPVEVEPYGRITTHSVTGREPLSDKAVEHYRSAIASACEGWTMPDGLRKHLETALWSLPTALKETSHD